MIEIRRANPADWEEIWPILHAVVASGDTYAYPPEIDKEEAFVAWYGPKSIVYVSLLEGIIVGTYILRPNMPGQGSHVANASFMVHPQWQGRGLGKAMGLHALEEAKKADYKAMQFNLVVSTNKEAMALWKNLGFSIVGTLPKSFRHQKLGLVDAFIMHRFLH